MSCQTAKIGSLVDIQDSEDPEGLRVFYYLVQDLKVSFAITHNEQILIRVCSLVLDLLADLLALQDQADLNCSGSSNHTSLRKIALSRLCCDSHLLLYNRHTVTRNAIYLAAESCCP